MKRSGQAPTPDPAVSVIELAPGLSATVADSVDLNAPGAMFLCSSCYKTFPLKSVHVVPTYNGDLGKYVGSNRCDADWKPSLEETRVRFAAHPTDAELASLLEVFRIRGFTDQDLGAFTQGRSNAQAGAAVVDATENGTLKLTLDGRRE